MTIISKSQVKSNNNYQIQQKVNRFSVTNSIFIRLVLAQAQQAWRGQL